MSIVHSKLSGCMCSHILRYFCYVKKSLLADFIFISIFILFTQTNTHTSPHTHTHTHTHKYSGTGRTASETES